MLGCATCCIIKAKENALIQAANTMILASGDPGDGCVACQCLNHLPKFVPLRIACKMY